MYATHTATAGGLVLPSRIMDIGSRRFEDDDTDNIFISNTKDGGMCPPSSMTLLRHVNQPQAFVIPPLSNVSHSIQYSYILSKKL